MEQKERLVDSQFERILQLLISRLEDGSLRRSILSALHSWVKYSSGDLSPSLGTSLLETGWKFIHLGLQSSEMDVLEEACELVCELFYRQHQSEQPESEGWLKCLFEGLLSVYNSVIGSNDEDTEEIMRKVSLVFAEAGQAFTRHLMDNPQVMQLIITILLQLIEQSHDSNTVQGTFGFWEILSERISDESEATQESYSPVFGRLLQSCIQRHLVYPNNLTAEAMDKFRDFRHVVGDCLKDCVRAMGSSAALTIIKEELGSSMSRSGWEPAEAALFALRTVASAIDRRESEVLPILIPGLLGIRQPGKLVYAVNLNIGCYSDWMRYHPEVLPPVLDFISFSLQQQQQQLSNDMDSCKISAIYALKYLSESCGRLLVRYLPQLESLYTGTIESFGSDTRSVFDLTQALGHVLANLDISLLPGHWQTITDLWLRKLGSFGTDRIIALEALNSLLIPFDQDSNQLIQPDHPVLIHFKQSIWPMVSGLNNFDSAMIPALVEFLKTCIMVLGPGLDSDWDASFLQLIQKTLPVSLEPFAALRVFILHTPEARRDAALPFIIMIFSVPGTLGILGRDESFADYLSACTAALDYCPTILSDVSVASGLVLGWLEFARSAIFGANPPNPTDIAAGLHLLQHLLQSFMNDPACPGLPILLPGCLACFQSILSACLTAYPPDLLADIPPCLLRLQRISPGSPAQLMQGLLAGLPEGAFLQRERQAYLQQFQAAMEATRAVRELKDLLRLMAQTCKRRLHHQDNES